MSPRRARMGSRRNPALMRTEVIADREISTATTLDAPMSAAVTARVPLPVQRSRTRPPRGRTASARAVASSRVSAWGR